MQGDAWHRMILINCDMHVCSYKLALCYEYKMLMKGSVFCKQTPPTEIFSLNSSGVRNCSHSGSILFCAILPKRNFSVQLINFTCVAKYKTANSSLETYWCIVVVLSHFSFRVCVKHCLCSKFSSRLYQVNHKINNTDIH